MNLFDLSGKVAVITGGSSGIGLGMAMGLANAGANVVIVSRDQKKSNDALAELKRIDAKAAAFSCDVSNEASIRETFAAIAKAHGRIDILVNNAGTNIRRRPEELSHQDWSTVMSTNLDSAFLCSQAAYPHLKKSGHGKVINLGSMLSIFGSPWGPAYAASKGGIVQLTKSLATAWAADNIQVNCLLPGWIDTPLTVKAREEIAGLHEKVLARTPAKRWGRPDDFHGIAVFLACAASDFVTGAAIPVDGGYSISVL